MKQLNSIKDNAEQELADLDNTAERNELERQQFYESLVEDINDLQENYQELLDTGVLQTNINEKLGELEEEYAPKLTKVTAQLAHIAHDVTQHITDDDRTGVLATINNAKDGDKIFFPSRETPYDIGLIETDKKLTFESNGIINGTIKPLK